MSGRHAHPPTIRDRLKRKWLGLPIVVWLLAILGAGVAIAALVFTLNGVSGSFSFTIANNYDVEYADVDDGTQDCTASFTASTLTIDTWANFGPGSTCDLAIRFVNTGNTDVYLDDLVETDPLMNIVEDPLGAQPGQCLDLLPIGGGPWFDFTITIEDPGDVPGTYNIDLSSIGFEFSDVNTDGGDCDSTT